MDPKLLAAARAAFPANPKAVTLGAPVHRGECHPEPLVAVPLAMLNRHGLIAGATGTGKTKTLQLMAEQISAAGVPVFLADLKGDLSGLAMPGEPSERVSERAAATGYPWKPAACPVEFLSLTGKHGAQLRATVSSFGPLLLAQRARPQRDADQRADDGLQVLRRSGAPAARLRGPARRPRVPLGRGRERARRLRRDVEGHGRRAAARAGGARAAGRARVSSASPSSISTTCCRSSATAADLISVLELSDVQDKPALFSTFMMWMLARLYAQLPEVGDLEKPKLVFFFDEAHWLFEGASRAFLEQVEQVVRLVRSKGVGIFFVTQSPKDVPPDVLAQLGNRVQHALRAFTPDDEKALRAAARTFPRTEFYDVAETLTTLGIGEALVTVLGSDGAPTPPFATRLIPPASRMGPLDRGRARRAALDAAGAPLRGGGGSRQRRGEARATPAGGGAGARGRPPAARARGGTTRRSRGS